MSTATVTKKKAVEQLIDGAIRTLETGDYACSITLAGAAEGAMPPAGTPTLFEITRDAFVGRPLPGSGKKAEKTVVSVLNAERDWLKHYNDEQPDQMQLDHAIVWVLRAISKFQAVYGREAETRAMQEFFAAARAFDPED